MNRRPLILVCNDDGVHAPGLQYLTEVAHRLGEVVVVAPDSPQSGMGHAVTINDTLRVADMSRQKGYPMYSCSGTPVDCVKLAMNKLLPRRPDLVVSGINHGSNSSVNVIYSGTMSAAIEGAIAGITSLGFSLCDHSYDADFGPSLPWVEKLMALALYEAPVKGMCLNVNFPKGPVKGYRFVRQARAYWAEEMDERTDPRGGKYFWLTGVFEVPDTGRDTDEYVLSQGYASVVPVTFDLTDYAVLEKLRQMAHAAAEKE
ncbi:MAG: 5'/3'-nucleotidase SurE [Flavobacteriales bacterium]|nr:5'/3'-nucleotidase SurE [Flavobacteriales bacterium]MCX7649859.1 5'/3'-nucleotidase SurE [Flavobacteriales bacterium]MDW8432907.1 5'/3'-nucleotidase SurE [Flavobacteriales bacterium]